MRRLHKLLADALGICAALYGGVFHRLEAALDGWFLGLVARLVFAAVLFGYYWASALTKIGEGWAGVFSIQDGAYVQIAPQAMEAYGYDASRLPFFPWDVVVALGTYSELALPLLIVAGLLTRVAAVAMIVFVLVQSWVDVAFHRADAATLGALFDHTATSAILDQRTLWIFLLLYLVVKGPGRISLDSLLSRSAMERRRPKSAI